MPLKIDSSLSEELSTTVKLVLSKMPDDQQKAFCEEYSKKKKLKNKAWLLFWFAYGYHMVYLGEGVGKWILFCVTIGGCCIWAFVEMFSVSRKVEKYNDQLATKIVQNIQLASG